MSNELWGRGMGVAREGKNGGYRREILDGDDEDEKGYAWIYGESEDT